MWIRQLQWIVLRWALLPALLIPFASRSVLFYSTGDPTYNTTAPGGSLTNSGWQFQGQWGGFLGTAIAPKYFITAKHVGRASGGAFWFQGTNHLVSEEFRCPDADLSIWRVCGTLSLYAPLFTGTNEVGRPLVVMGRGTPRGAGVTVTTGSVVEPKGWLWDAYDGVQRWGENEVSSIFDGDAASGSELLGDLLMATFDSGAGTNECHLSWGDSGGAVFLQEDSTWKLAGINYSVSGPYNTSTNGGGFSAAIFDEGGLFTGGMGDWMEVPDETNDQPGAFFATRISSNLDWIQSVLTLPIPDDAWPKLQSAARVDGPYADMSDAQVDETSRTITIPQPAQDSYYRLRSCCPTTIVSVEESASNLVLRYE